MEQQQFLQVTSRLSVSRLNHFLNLTNAWSVNTFHHDNGDIIEHHMQWVPGLVLPVIGVAAFEDGVEGDGAAFEGDGAAFEEDGVGNDVEGDVEDLGEVVNSLPALPEIEIVAVAPLNLNAPLMALQNPLLAPAVNEDAPHGFEDGAAGQNAVVQNAEDGAEILERPLKRRRRSI
ncbi:PREDICTED: uncharacterized protein LOC104721885 [Camelina sativa]|uniref:Uncharacterized protein LOC104721885 n=1 Tax=Camelina sativa TaxID=90675 RepID=A0ABM0UAD8_CAMSA|nr:PREDICTED: uncharacterized protein LOC104721885 [Camelina sativa]